MEKHRPREQTSPPDADRDDLRDLSVVVPLMNEEDNVRPMHRELAEVLDGVGLDYEIIYVDDGSKDRSLERLLEATAGQPRVTVITFRRNFGQTQAMAAGITHSRGRVIVPMDADLQNDPHDIPAMLARLDGPTRYDIVSGWRKSRKDKWLSRRLPSLLANRLIRWATGVRIHDFGCTLKAYRREVIEDVSLSSELHRFLPALAVWHGAKITDMVVNHRPRMHGTTKYGLRRTIKVLLDLVTVMFLGTYMTKPLYFFSKIGFLSLLLGSVFLGIAICQKYVVLWHETTVNLNNNVLVPLAGLLCFFTVQCVLFGVISEMLVRIFHQGQGRPAYHVRHVYRRGEPDDADRPGGG